MIKFVDVFSNNQNKKGKSRHYKCSNCKTKMTSVSGAVMRREDMYAVKQGSICRSCGRTLCDRCSDMEAPCKCKHTTWSYFTYLDGHIS